MKICGKLLTSEIASDFIHGMNNDVVLPKSSDTTFVQIVKAGTGNAKSRKGEQLENLEVALSQKIARRDY